MTEPSDHVVTQVLVAVRDRQAGAVDRLLPVVYDELRALAQRFLRREKRNHTLQPTALVHEAYLRLIDQREAKWQDRAHFCAIAAQAIRRVLIDHARARKRQKRGGDRVRVTLSAATPIFVGKDTDLLALDEALERLAETEPLGARIVEMRFFGELTVEEVAEVLDMSDRSVRRHWKYAKAWLFREIKKGDTQVADRG